MYSGGVRAKYEALVRKQAGLAMSLADVISRPLLHEDSDDSECDHGPALAECVARLDNTTSDADGLLQKKAWAIIAASVAIENSSVATGAAKAAEMLQKNIKGPDSSPTGAGAATKVTTEAREYRATTIHAGAAAMATLQSCGEATAGAVEANRGEKRRLIPRLNGTHKVWSCAEMEEVRDCVSGQGIAGVIEG